jgi:hypothetical protein
VSDPRHPLRTPVARRARARDDVPNVGGTDGHGGSKESAAGRPSWRDANQSIFAETVAAAAEQIGVQPLAVEKDYWVCQALRAIEAHAAGATIFKGGTSLEKLRLIERFSEDLDLLVVGSYATRGAVERALKGMCAAAEAALPGCVQEKDRSGGKPGSMHRSAYLTVPLGPHESGTAIADPGAILLELGQSGGSHPASVREVTSLLGRQLAAAGVAVDGHVDLAPFGVRILHPGRTLIEKLLRVNNFALDEPRRADRDGFPRIGRQFYDIWALLGDPEVQELLADTDEAAQVMADCARVSEAFRPDLPPPPGGFSASPAFDPTWEFSTLLRDEHGKAMRDLYYGTTTPPSFDDVLERVRASAALLDITA